MFFLGIPLKMAFSLGLLLALILLLAIVLAMPHFLPLMEVLQALAALAPEVLVEAMVEVALVDPTKPDTFLCVKHGDFHLREVDGEYEVDMLAGI
jgi:hypothetical protein